MLELSWRDELTGLYNRRGLGFLAEQQLKLSRRTMKGAWFVFVDLDGLKRINDTYGHGEGDKALIAAAKILQESFRTSDVIARIGGDEFAVLAIEASADSAEILIHRLKEKLRVSKGRDHRRFGLSLSFGASYFDPAHPCSLKKLMIGADRAMYRSKHEKPSGSSSAHLLTSL